MIVNMNEMLTRAKKEHYAVGAFNFNELSDLTGIVTAAVNSNSPVILMASTGTLEFFGIKEAAYAFKGMCENVDVPCALHLDHAKEFGLVKECLEAGFTSVMIDASTKSFDENIEITKRVADLAKKYGASTEAELGTVPGKEDNIDGKLMEFVDPDQVCEFIAKTGIDALAVGIGTVHGFYKKEPNLQFDLINEVAALTDVPLVMHGGTGLSEDDFKKVVACGIKKINVGTEIRHAFALQLYKSSNEYYSDNMDPRNILLPVRKVCEEIVTGKMRIFGCSGKAGT